MQQYIKMRFASSSLPPPNNNHINKRTYTHREKKNVASPLSIVQKRERTKKGA